MAKLWPGRTVNPQSSILPIDKQPQYILKAILLKTLLDPGY